MNRIFNTLALALAALALAFVPLAFAATTTTPTALSASAYTDLGVGPMYLGASGGPIAFQVADSQPTAGSAALLVLPGSPPVNLTQASAHVWALALSSAATSAVVSAGTGITASGGGGGGTGGNVDALPGSNLLTALGAGVGTPGLAVPSSGQYIGGRNGSGNFTGFLTNNNGSLSIVGESTAGVPNGGGVQDVNLVGGASGADPCMGSLKSSAAFSSATGQFKIITGTASKKTYICHIDYRVGGAAHVSVIEGTGTNCATGPAAIDGSTTAALGKAEAANGGEASGNGAGDIMHAATNADDVCILQDSTALIAGRVTYVIK